MSNISPNALFHFTSSAENIIGILSKTFIPRYSLEEVTFSTNEDDDKMLCVAIPMVCFCDIPLSQINSHIKTYGSYGIGMNKEWGIKNKLNPIIYLNENSVLSDSLNRMAKYITKDEYNDKIIDDEFIEISNFLKPYSGDFKRNNETLKNVRFYNEREWRYIPNHLNPTNKKLFLEQENYHNPVKLAQENSKLQKFALKFTPNDIKYIFVRDENEIHPMIQSLREIKGRKFDKKTIDILASKILTIKQIAEDF